MFIKTLFYSCSLLVLTSCASAKKNKPADEAPVVADTLTYNMQTKPGWQIFVNKVQVLQSNTEDVNANTKSVKTTDLFTADGLKIVYTEEPDAKVNRSFIIMDDNRQELYRTEKSGIVISGTELQKALGKNKTAAIYSLAIPSDPALAATVRVRPVHLCTLILQ